MNYPALFQLNLQGKQLHHLREILIGLAHVVTPDRKVDENRSYRERAEQCDGHPGQ